MIFLILSLMLVFSEPTGTIMEPVGLDIEHVIEVEETNDIYMEKRVSTNEIDILIEPPKYTEEMVDLLALVALAEAEGEGEYGQRLVIDTILNRVDHEAFPNTIEDVIFQKNAFSSMQNGRSDRVTITNQIRATVIEELYKRTNDEVGYFRTSHYSRYGTPLFVEGNHYFSSLEESK